MRLSVLEISRSTEDMTAHRRVEEDDPVAVTRRELATKKPQKKAKAPDRREGPPPECCVCMERPPNVAVYDCGHLCLCEACAKAQKRVFGKCPICNKVIKDMIKIFKV